MLDFTDVIGGPLKVLLEKTLASKIGRRAELLLEFSIASVISFFAVAGGCLMTDTSTRFALGAGMVAVSVAIFATFQVSDNAKGLIVSVTQKVVDEKFKDETTTIRR